LTKHHIEPDFEIIDIEGLSASYSEPIFTGNGGNRVGSTAVTLIFTLSDGSTVIETETLSSIKATISKDFIYTIGYFDVTVMVTVTVAGANNNMNITGVTAEIISKDISK